MLKEQIIVNLVKRIITQEKEFINEKNITETKKVQIIKNIIEQEVRENEN